MTSKIPTYIWYIIIIYCLILSAISLQDITIEDDINTFLIFFTLGGGYIALNKTTSKIKWQIADEIPVSRILKQMTNQYLPDLMDGSLYNMSGQCAVKLPYTIPQFVLHSPYTSSDGILFSGRKLDTWLMIDAATGRQEKLFEFDESMNRGISQTIYLSRTQYTLQMYQSPYSWIFNYYDYSSSTMAPEVSIEYEWIHITSNNGSVVTLNRNNKFQWQKDFSSPVIAAFLMGPKGVLSVPFIMVSGTELTRIIKYVTGVKNGHIHINQTLYVANYSNSLYIMSAVVDTKKTPKKKDSNRSSTQHDFITVWLQEQSGKCQIISTTSNISLPIQPDMQDHNIDMIGKFLEHLLLLVSNFCLLSMKLDTGVCEGCVKNISFNPHKILCKSFKGINVFKGTFATRNVAVKQFLPDTFNLAHHEAELLRKCDVHYNILYCFYTAKNIEHSYLVLELWAFNLDDYVNGKKAAELQQKISKINVLSQATMGLQHLHTHKIVHRNIKPHNILFSMSDPNLGIRVMLSDLTQSKDLNKGWFVSDIQKAKTRSVDIVSMGCVFSYVLTSGHHPFGEIFESHDSTKKTKYNLHHLDKLETLKPSAVGFSGILAKQIIEDMTNMEAAHEHTARAIYSHPVFWSSKKILDFLQNASDRIEKEESDLIERDSDLIIGGRDFFQFLDEELTDNLLHFRGYWGNRNKDLLRALRNTKHHYCQMIDKEKIFLGTYSLQQFTNYWIDTFPRLLSHVYHVMQSYSKEDLFKPYYDKGYTFIKPKYLMPQNDKNRNNNNSDDGVYHKKITKKNQNHDIKPGILVENVVK